jgi:hypothetical protein
MKSMIRPGNGLLPSRHLSGGAVDATAVSQEGGGRSSCSSID